MKKKKKNRNENWQNQIDRKQQKIKKKKSVWSQNRLFHFCIYYILCLLPVQTKNESTKQPTMKFVQTRSLSAVGAADKGKKKNKSHTTIHHRNNSKNIPNSNRNPNSKFVAQCKWWKDETRIQNTMKHGHNTPASRKPGCCCMYLFLLLFRFSFHFVYLCFV